jgi:hypothetical protein
MSIQALAERLARELEQFHAATDNNLTPPLGLADAAEALLIKLAEKDPAVAEIIDKTLYGRKV